MGTVGLWYWPAVVLWGLGTVEKTESGTLCCVTVGIIHGSIVDLVILSPMMLCWCEVKWCGTSMYCGTSMTTRHPFTPQRGGGGNQGSPSTSELVTRWSARCTAHGATS